MHIAITTEEENVGLVKLLLAAGADVNRAGPLGGQRPLHLAVNVGNIRAAKLLLSHDADVNARTEFGESPLHVAARQGNVQMAELLMAEGAKVNAKNVDGLSPLDYAISSGQAGKKVTDVLRQHGGKAYAQWPDVR